MAEESYPFVDQPVTDAQWADLAREYHGMGVIKRTTDGSDLKVTADSSGLKVKLAAGRADVRGHRYRNTTTKELVIERGAGQPRIDTVVLRREYAQVNNIRVYVKQGKPAPTAPKPPDLETTEDGVFEYALADIAVSANAVTITPANVTDRRVLWNSPDAPAVPPPRLDFGPGIAGIPWDGKSQQIIKTGSVVVVPNQLSIGTFTWPGDAFPNGITGVVLTSGDSSVVTKQLIVTPGTDKARCIFQALHGNGNGVGQSITRINFIAIGW